MMRGALFALSLAITSLACARSDREKNQGDLPKVRVSTNHLMNWAPIMIARAEGFFREEGIDVEYVYVPGNQEELVAFIKGDIDVLSGPTHAAFLSAISHGAKIRIVAGQGYLARDGCTYFGIVRRPGMSAIKRLRASRDGFTRFITSRMLETVNVDIKTLDVIRIPDAVAATSFEKGTIDAVASGEPLLTRLKSTAPVWLAAEKVVPDFQWGTIAFSDRLLHKDRQSGVRFLRAYNRGVAQYLQGKTNRNIAIIAEATGQTPELIRQACWLPFRSDLTVNWQGIEQFEAWAKKEGFIQEILTRDQAMDSTFVTDLTHHSTATTQ